MKRLFILSILSAILFLLPASVFATSPSGIINSADFYCDAVRINYSIAPNGSPIVFNIYNGANPNTATLLGSAFHGLANGTFNMTIDLGDVIADEGTRFYIFVETSTGFPLPQIIGYGRSGDCAGYLGVVPTALNLFGGVGARATVLIQSENNGANNPVLVIYDVNEESEGSLLFYISLNNVINDYPADAGETVLIFENESELIRFYRLASGELQINLGPDFEGKMHVVRFTWDGGDPYVISYTTYFVSAPHFFESMGLYPTIASLPSTRY